MEKTWNQYIVKNVKMTLISVDKQTKDASSWLKTWKRQKKKALILWGHVGTGKTTLAYQIAEQHNYGVVEFNASDLRNKQFMLKLKKLSLQNSFEPTLILLDECDTLESRIPDLKAVIEKTQKPIILTTNYYGRLSGVSKVCKSIRFYKPKLSDLSKLEGSDLSKLSHSGASDFRQAVAVGHGSQGYSATSDNKRERLLGMIRSGKYEKLDMVDATFLLDSSTELYGFELYEWIKALSCWDICKRDTVLNGLKPDIKNIKEFYFSKKRMEK